MAFQLLLEVLNLNATAAATGLQDLVFSFGHDADGAGNETTVVCMQTACDNYSATPAAPFWFSNPIMFLHCVFHQSKCLFYATQSNNRSIIEDSTLCLECALPCSFLFVISKFS